VLQQGANFADEDIDEILKRAEQKTQVMMKQFTKAKEEGLSSDMWTFGACRCRALNKAEAWARKDSLSGCC
jgi:hypothetical protein